MVKVVDAELAIQRFHIAPHCLHCNVQRVGRLLDRVALAQHHQYFVLACGQLVVCEFIALLVEVADQPA